MRDPDTGNSKGFGFVNFASFEASDAAIEAMNGQHLCNRPISVTYAFRKDAKGERHGSAAGTAVSLITAARVIDWLFEKKYGGLGLYIGLSMDPGPLHLHAMSAHCALEH
jgi:RNA recognition motif-containing protein